jgi:hypothetical protein
VRRALRLPQRDEQQAGELLYKPTAPTKPIAAPAPTEGEEKPELASEMFARTRGRGRRAAQPWEKTVNEYQRNLGSMFDAWAEEVADDISATDDEDLQDDILLAALMRLSHEMTLLGRSNILDAVAAGVGGDNWRKPYLDVAGRHMAINEEYIENSLTKDMRSAIRNLIGAGLVGAALKDAIVGSFNARAESYAGEAWGALQETVGERSKFSEDPRVLWRRDPQAQHCETCLEYGDREYDGYDAMLAETGDSAPGINTICDGNCRCWLEVIGESGEFGRPSYFSAQHYSERLATNPINVTVHAPVTVAIPRDALRVEASVTMPKGSVRLETHVAAPKVDVNVAAPSVTVPVSVPKDSIHVHVLDDVDEEIEIERGSDSLVKRLVKRRRKAKPQ